MIYPQFQQLINLGLLLLLGKYTAHIYLPWKHILLILLVTVCIEHLMLYMKENEITFFSFSSLSTAIGVMLMMVTSSIWITILLITFGLFQKHFLQYKNEHFFNPSNFALMMGLLFFYQDAHIVLGQLGDSTGLGIVVALLGISILYRVDRWIIPLSFFIVYLVLQYVFVVSNDPVLIMENIYDRFYSVSFMVFILFMLTDPKTTPQKGWQQIMFSVFIAAVATLLDYIHGFRVQHLFMSLFVLSPLVPLLMNWKKFHYKTLLVMSIAMLFLSLSAIIYIEMKPPYYFEMEG